MHITEAFQNAILYSFAAFDKISTDIARRAVPLQWLSLLSYYQSELKFVPRIPYQICKTSLLARERKAPLRVRGSMFLKDFLHFTRSAKRQF